MPDTTMAKKEPNSHYRDAKKARKIKMCNEGRRDNKANNSLRCNSSSVAHGALQGRKKKNSNQSTPPFLDSLFLHSSTRLWVAGMDRMLQPRDYSNNSIVFTPEIIFSSV